MKARVIAKQSMALYHGFEMDEAKLLKTLDYAGFVSKKVGENQGDEILGYLFGYNGFASTTKNTETANEKFLIISGSDNKKISQLLSKLSEYGIDCPLKATCTGTNQSWTVNKLVAEIAHEHKTIHGGNQLEK